MYKWRDWPWPEGGMGDPWDEREGRVEGNRCGRAARFGGKMN